MLLFRVIAVLLLTTAIESARKVPKAFKKPRDLHPDDHLNIYQFAEKYGYPIETHYVQTDDGYVLGLHRIPHGANSTSTELGPPVLLMHGLLSSSVDWVNMGPGKALGLLLADSGYDVWMGNQRGNTWSRKHITLDPDLDAAEFFDFSFHEIGTHDLPAKIDYILEQTGQEKLFYVGHSQGTTDFYVMSSERPEYNDKIRLMTSLAPIGYMGHLPNPLIELLVQDYYDLVMGLIEMLEIHEFLPYFDIIGELSDDLCSDGSDYQELCVFFLNVICGFDHQIDPNFIPVITSNAPAGSSIKQIQHYAQQIKSGNLSQYDYGTEENLVKYGQETPPLYDTSKMTAPVSLYYANNDYLAAIEDVLRLAGELPNLVTAKKVSLDEFNHLDFIWAQDVVEMVYNDVIAEIKAN